MTPPLTLIAVSAGILIYFWVRCALIDRAKWTRCKRLIEQYKESYEPSDWDDWRS